MRKFHYSKDLLISENQRLVKRVWKVTKCREFPEGLEFAMQLLIKKSSVWRRVLRIDNQIHNGKPGVHIHRRGYVKWLDITLREAEELIMGYANEN